MVSRPLLYRSLNQEQDIELEAHYIDWTNPTIVDEWRESVVTRLISDLLGYKVDAVFLVRFGSGTQWHQGCR